MAPMMAEARPHALRGPTCPLALQLPPTAQLSEHLRKGSGPTHPHFLVSGVDLRSQGLEKCSLNPHLQPGYQDRTTGHDSHERGESGQEAGRCNLSLQPRNLGVQLSGGRLFLLMMSNCC